MRLGGHHKRRHGAPEGKQRRTERRGRLPPLTGLVARVLARDRLIVAAVGTLRHHRFGDFLAPGDPVGLGLAVGNRGQRLVVGRLHHARIGPRPQIREHRVGRARDGRIDVGARGRRVIHKPAAVRARDAVHRVVDRDVVGRQIKGDLGGGIAPKAGRVDCLLIPVDDGVPGREAGRRCSTPDQSERQGTIGSNHHGVMNGGGDCS